MEIYDNYGTSNEYNGINLDNYFPYEQNYGNTVYIHKKFYSKFFPQESKEKKKKDKIKSKFFKKTNKWNSEKQISSLNNDYVVDQTIKFAETLAPIVIPRNNEDVIYTVKATSKSKRKNKKIQTDTVYEENLERKSKKIVETFRRDFRTQNSIKESLSSQNNTLDDININQSLSCTISEQSEKKYSKKEFNYKKKSNTADRIVISESFEALATEFTENEDRKIKIHLMNERDKNFLSDSIKMPVLNAVKDCISELNNVEIREDMKYVQGFVQCNTQKLDCIIDKLSQIERYLQQANVKPNPLQNIRTSTLEELGEDLEDEKSDEQNSSVVMPFVHNSVVIDNTGCGEAPVVRPTTSTGMKTDKPNKIPARFCWTDVGRVN